MKKQQNKRGVTAAKIVAGIAATLVVGSNLNGCGVYGPPSVTDNDNPDVYGPPATESVVETDENDQDETLETDNMNEDVYGPPQGDFYAEDNEMDCVYGPPDVKDE